MFLTKRLLTQICVCELSKLFQNIFFKEHLLTYVEEPTSMPTICQCANKLSICQQTVWNSLFKINNENTNTITEALLLQHQHHNRNTCYYILSFLLILKKMINLVPEQAYKHTCIQVNIEENWQRPWTLFWFFYCSV